MTRTTQLTHPAPGVMSRFELALLGAGRMGQTHLRALAGPGPVAVRHVVEPAAGLRESIARDGYLTYPTLSDLLERASPDGVLVAAPTAQHEALLRSLVLAGLPVLCEKPAGLTPDAVTRACQFAAERGAVVQVAYWRRYVPALQHLRDRIAGGAFGDIHLLAAAQWDGQPPSAAFRAGSGGIFVDMGVHEFDQICWLTGQRITRVEAVSARLVSDPAVDGDVDSAQALLELSGGSTALVSLGRHFPEGDMAMAEIFGTRRHERLMFLDPTAGESAMLTALARQAAGFAELVRSADRSGAGLTDAVTAHRAAGRAQRAAQAVAVPPL